MGCVTISVLGTVGLQLQGEGVYCAQTMHGTLQVVSLTFLCEGTQIMVVFHCLPEQGIPLSHAHLRYLTFPSTSTCTCVTPTPFLFICTSGCLWYVWWTSVVGSN